MKRDYSGEMHVCTSRERGYIEAGQYKKLLALSHLIVVVVVVESYIELARSIPMTLYIERERVAAAFSAP